ncbi:MAG: hypothetical protein AAFX87_17495 [Bacteroidota bacterium]
MFDGPDYPKSLEEDQFDTWLEQGRTSKIGYHYLLIIWDAFESKYLPIYTEERPKAGDYERYGDAIGQESLVAVYDLYSESRISLGE